jgi:hypothetical protein
MPLLLCIASHKMYAEEFGEVNGVKRRTFEPVSTYRGSYEKLNSFWTWKYSVSVISAGKPTSSFEARYDKMFSRIHILGASKSNAVLTDPMKA